ncbi:glycosyltransferase [Tumebacillus sp. ITR2]|uniref:Glycosyltransferase n=1 Tax=Tumebacillus amylolyticus TaxID=2801339 RepID=A0ABS1JFF9_9BACL|nr:glycosyltransferase [Tumebacillus amylolyticus]MBL0388983.1 glycosyltransferase [Tumebacillus amylolyticus]
MTTSVLILTSDFGEGHQQVAEAIHQVLEADHPDLVCRVVNVMECLHPRLHLIGRTVFLQAVKKLPSLYGFLYRKTYGPTLSSHFLSELTNFGLKRLEHLLQEEQPCLVVSTFPFASAAMSHLRKQLVTQVPLVTLITDHTFHQAWIHPETDLYLVGSERVLEGLVQCGIPASAIQVTGIPLRPAFEKNYSKHHLRMLHGLSPTTPTVLILGGGFGLFGEEIFDPALLESLPAPVQLVIICGHNEKAKAHVERAFAHRRDHVKVLGFVDNMHEWMAMADLVLTKPGGVTTAEAMALQLPMLLYKPIPGQEEDNLRYLVESGVALAATSKAMLWEKLHTLLSNDAELARMKTCAKREGRKHSARDATALLEPYFARMPLYQ